MPPADDTAGFGMKIRDAMTGNRLEDWAVVAIGIQLFNREAVSAAKSDHGPAHERMFLDRCKRAGVDEVAPLRDELLEMARNLDLPADEPWRSKGIRDWYTSLDVSDRAELAWQMLANRPHRRLPLHEPGILPREWKRATLTPDTVHGPMDTRG